MIAKTDIELENLRHAGKVLSYVIKETMKAAQEGVTTADLDLLAEKLIREEGAVPAFLNYKPRGAKYPYPAALCVSVNDEVVHGIPSKEHVLQKGDMVTLDLGLSYNGYFVDSARTLFVGEGDPKGQKLMDATREALSVAIQAAKVGGRVGDIGAAVEVVARRYSFAVVEELGGHAVGKGVHEKPFIANFGVVGEGEKLVDGLVLALEPILSEGKGTISLMEDEWTYVTRDGSRAAHFEQTILLTPDGPEILTPFL
jgi:methionyl aminopeptidase